MENKTPSSLGFFMPAEWECHEGTWLQWPHDDTHHNSQVRQEHLWLAMAATLLEHEIVHLTVPDERRFEHLISQLAYFGLNLNQIDIHLIPTNDVWSRDNGPIFLINDRGGLAITSLNFNGWGERYPFDKDRLVPESVAKILGLPFFTSPITLEGGAIEVNGKGTLIATRTSIINPNRNPGLSQEQVESAIKQYLGVNHIIWLSGGSREFCNAVGDDTDLHIDGFARFVDESTVLYSWTEDENHPFYPILIQHLIELQSAETESGKPLTLVPLPIPENKMYSTLQISPTPPFKSVPSLAIYANFYIANQVVLVPVYGDVNDAQALDIIADHFPGRQIVPLPTQVTAELGGMMHCVTQQQPIAPIKL